MTDKEGRVTILRGDPVVDVLATMALRPGGVLTMANWVRQHRPECMPEGYDELPTDSLNRMLALFPHRCGPVEEGGRRATDNELLVELAGRKCYDSFGERAGKKTNREYIENTQQGEVPHRSILYHAKMTFFFAGISRRVSHEIIRNYVGSDRDEEGAPSQESTRFTHHYGYFVEPPRYGGPHEAEEGYAMRAHFEQSMQAAYDNYLKAVQLDVELYKRRHGEEPRGIDRKRIYEAASSFLPHQAETSFVWTTNPEAVAKLVRERADNAADLEIQRFARTLARVAVAEAPNLFPQPHMRTYREEAKAV